MTVQFTTPKGEVRKGKLISIGKKRATVMVGKTKTLPPLNIVKEVKKKEMSKELLQDVMNVMTEVAKEKKKSQKYEIDERTTLNKQAQEGKIKFKDLYSYALNDDGFSEFTGDRVNDVAEGLSWGSDFYRLVKKVTKRDVDSYEELTEKQQDKFADIIRNESEKLHMKFIKEEVFNKFIKGKKFKTANQARKVFMDKYDETY